MELSLLDLKKDFWCGESNFSLFLDCPYLMEGGFVILCIKGEATISIGIQECEIRKNADSIVLPGTTLNLIKSSTNFRCRLFSFSKEVYDASSIRLGVDFSLFLSESPYYIHPEDSVYLKNLYTWMDMANIIFEERKTQFAYQMYCHFVQNYLSYLYDKIEDQFKLKDKKFTREHKLFHQFSSLLDTYCRQYRDVAFYADKLNITTRYLWTITNHVTSFESPKDVIDRRSVLEIKVMLQSTDLSIQEIGVELKFPNQSYLGRFFKRYTGISPREYRNKIALFKK